MRRRLDALRPGGAGDIPDHQRDTQGEAACDIAALRPFRAVLAYHDYWDLQEHRRRCEDLGGALFMRLARLIRAKSADALVINDDEIPPDTVTGTARVAFAIDRHRPETRTLYHWGFPDRARCRLPVCTFLGVTLIGMSVGQRAPLLDAKGVVGEVQILAVHAQAGPQSSAGD
ncbi:MAG: hypothetical protein JJT95_00195 [Pararhodobacter sp.]|nr:hypothetical protein [Pararhodobacter sp.]